MNASSRRLIANAWRQRSPLYQGSRPLQNNRHIVTITKNKRTEMESAQSFIQEQQSASLQPAPQLPTTTNDLPVNITPSCVNRIRQLAQKRSEADWYLRVFVDAGGCSGFQYKFELERGAIDQNEDVILKPAEDVQVVIDNESLQYMQGSTIEYIEEMIKSSFAVTANPQSEKACGCGSSFALKNFQKNPALD